jgi:AraC family transcriptional regulator of adaptative response/methylated-DNA-[protein]-cysteine methyltransferase
MRNLKQQWTTDDSRWEAVVARDKDADGHFVYAVRTTGIYCHPSATARLPKRENVEFFDSAQQAEQQGYRPSKRLRRGDPKLEEHYKEKMIRACRFIAACTEPVSLQEIADHVGLSSFHFHRLFKEITGITPMEYATANRRNRVRDKLRDPLSVTEAIFDAGFNSNSRFYASSAEMLGMTPKVWKTGGTGTTIYFALGICSLGNVLVAQSEKGICAILLGDEAEKLLQDLQDQFPQAALIGADPEFETVVAQVVGFIEAPQIGLDLPLDIRGTVFQQRVWQALKEIPVGTTVTYAEIAKRIGSPKAVRAVANACAANRLAVAIPCHRVVRTNGSLSGYRWGIDRKRALINREKKED